MTRILFVLCGLILAVLASIATYKKGYRAGYEYQKPLPMPVVVEQEIHEPIVEPVKYPNDRLTFEEFKQLPQYESVSAAYRVFIEEVRPLSPAFAEALFRSLRQEYWDKAGHIPVASTQASIRP